MLRPALRLSPRSPKTNRRFERLRRTFGVQFDTRPLTSHIPELQRELNAYLDHYDKRRPYRPLNDLAPLEFLAMMQEESVPEGGESQM